MVDVLVKKWSKEEQSKMIKVLCDNADKRGKVVRDDEIQNIRRIVEGMNMGNFNIMIFKDCDEIWMQYHMGMYLKKPILILAKEEDRHNLNRVQLGKKVHIEYVKSFNDIDFIMDKLKPKLKEMMEYV